MKKLILAGLFLFSSLSQAQWYTAYYATWNQEPFNSSSWNGENLGQPPNQVDWTGITHVVHFGNGNIGTASPYLWRQNGSSPDTTEITFGPNGGSTDYQSQLISICHSKGIKVCLSLQAVDPTGLHAALASQGTANTFASYVATYCKSHNYDGVEIDWEGEHPDPTLGTRLLLTLRTYLNAAYGPTGASGGRAQILLSPGISDYDSYPHAACDTAVDQFNPQFYAMMWSPNNTNHAWHTCPVYPGTAPGGEDDQALDGLTDGSAGDLQGWIDNGHSPAKVGLLLPTFGYFMLGTDAIFGAETATIGHNGSRTVTQNSMLTGLLTVGGTYTWDAVRQMGYIHGTANKAYGQAEYGGVANGQKFFATVPDRRWVDSVYSYWKIKTFSGQHLGGFSLYSLTEDFDPTKPAGQGRNIIHDALRDVLSSTPQATITVSVSSLPAFDTTLVGNNSASKNYTVSGTLLTANVVVTAPAGFQVSTNNSTFSTSVTLVETAGTLGSTTVYARFSPSSSGLQSGTISHTSGTATAQYVSVSGVGTTPPPPPAAVTVSVSSLPDFGSVTTGTNSASTTYTVSGVNLTANVVVTAPAGFAVSKNNSTFSTSVSYAPTAGTLAATTVYARFSPVSTGFQTGSITNASTGATTQNVTVSGTGISPPPPATITVSVTSLANFGTVNIGNASASASYTVSGTSLTSNVTVTAPSGFQVSTNNSTFFTSVTLVPSAGTLGSTTVYARFVPTVTGAQNGSISHASAGATTKNVSVSGTGANPPPPSTMTVSVDSLPNFGNIITGSNSTSASYRVSGSNLLNNIVITAPSGFGVSTNNVTFTNSVTLTQSGGTVASTTIYARFSPSFLGAQGGSITHVSGGATTLNVSVSGTGVAAPPTPTITINSSSIADFGSINVGSNSAAKKDTVSGTGLTANVTVAAPSGFAVSTDSITFSSSVTLTQVGGTLSATKIFARFSPTSAGVQGGSISCSSSGAGTKSIAVSGTGVALPPPQVVTVSVQSLPDFGSVTTGSNSASTPYQVSGTNLVADVGVKAPAGFEVSLDNVTFADSVTLNQFGGTLAASNLYARFSPSGTGFQTGSIVHTSGSATSRSVVVSGTGISPPPADTVTVSATSLPDFGSVIVGQVSGSSSYFVSGVHLVTNVTVTAPAGFQVSIDNTSFWPSVVLTPLTGTLSATLVYVRFAPGAVGPYSGSVSNVSDAATSQYVTVSGTGVAPKPIVAGRRILLSR